MLYIKIPRRLFANRFWTNTSYKTDSTLLPTTTQHKTRLVPSLWIKYQIFTDRNGASSHLIPFICVINEAYELFRTCRSERKYKTQSIGSPTQSDGSISISVKRLPFTRNLSMRFRITITSVRTNAFSLQFDSIIDWKSSHSEVSCGLSHLYHIPYPVSVQ